MSIFIWEWKDSYKAMQWPCPSGFHVPMRDEFYAVLDVWTGLWGLNTEWNNFIMALKLPFAGRRYSSSANTASQNTNGYYWASTRTASTNAHILSCKSSQVTVSNYVSGGWGCIRPFKDTPVIPTSSWTKLYWTSIEAWWIFWSSTDWLISMSSDWTNRITIADKNLWATQVWNSWDTLSEANCGKYYQRGNNYWFPRTWTISNTSSTQVDTTWYWPWNYYLDNTFIIGNDDWASPRNANLRWWATWITKWNNVSQIYIWEWKDDYSAMQWPCSTGFHIPMQSEFVALVSAVNSIWIDTTNWVWVKTYLKFPLAWCRNNNADATYQWTQGLYWGSDTTSYVWNGMVLTDSGLNAQFNYYRVYAFPIRPFKDEPVIPDSSWTTLYAWTWDAGIFHNSTLWLIRISSDWTTWITIADKNLWATTVYNSWDTLSEANCGKYFQWGNCSWLAWTWSVTKIPWGLDVSDYWPWNYYSNSAFIYSNNSNYDWALPSNNNLRWWVTGITKWPNVKEVYKWTTKIRPV